MVIAEVFDGLGVEWTLVGALAANRYRVTPRFTPDVDTMATYHPDLVSVLVGAGYALEVIADEGEPPHLDRDDVRSILEADAALDQEYLERWITEWDLVERWATFDGSP